MLCELEKLLCSHFSLLDIFVGGSALVCRPKQLMRDVFVLVSRQPTNFLHYFLLVQFAAWETRFFFGPSFEGSQELEPVSFLLVSSVSCRPSKNHALNVQLRTRSCSQWAVSLQLQCWFFDIWKAWGGELTETTFVINFLLSVRGVHAAH